MLLPSALGFSPHPPVSVYGTGVYDAIAAFLDTWPALFPTLSSVRITPLAYAADLPAAHLLRLPRVPSTGRAFHICPHSSDHTQCRNLNLLSIGYDFRPRLRPRLTQGRSASPWNPWIFGREDSHLSLATHSGILSSIRSTAPCRYRFAAYPMLLYQCIYTFPSFGVVFQPRTFSAQGLSTSELLRTL
jgi:hypothetical protein